MLFNSIIFVVFLPVVLLGVAVLPTRWRNPFLLIASYVFYGSWNWRFLGLLCVTTTVDFYVARAIFRTANVRRRKQLLLVSLGTNLTILGFFKYFNFFVDSAAALLEVWGIHLSPSTLSVVLPVGISFYTFQSMAYVIDVYRGNQEPTDHLKDYALCLSFFPQLVAGPIERAAHLLPQLLSPAKVNLERVNRGLTLIMMGFTKKVLIADQVAPEVARIFADPGEMSSGVLLRGAYLFALQIYGDFSGYTDIARGVGELLGVSLMKNFEQPYLSQSITEFWRRWHISLSSWLRDYLYIPLGGNRHGQLNTYRNLMLTMLIGGLWHGANWTFVAWGGLNGLYLAVERMFGIGRAGSDPAEESPWRWLPRLASMVLTFHLVTLTWIFFRAPNFSVAFEYLAGILRFQDLGAVGPWPFVAALGILAMDVPQYLAREDAVFLRMRWWVQSPLYACLCLALVLYGGSEVPFIYFQF